MGCRAFQEEKKFRRTDFGEEFALNSLLNGSHLHRGGEGFLLGIMNVFGLVPNSSKKKPQGCIQLREVICKPPLLPRL